MNNRQLSWPQWVHRPWHPDRLSIFATKTLSIVSNSMSIRVVCVSPTIAQQVKRKMFVRMHRSSEVQFHVHILNWVWLATETLSQTDTGSPRTSHLHCRMTTFSQKFGVKREPTLCPIIPNGCFYAVVLSTKTDKRYKQM